MKIDQLVLNTDGTLIPICIDQTILEQTPEHVLTEKVILLFQWNSRPLNDPYANYRIVPGSPRWRELYSESVKYGIVDVADMCCYKWIRLTSDEAVHYCSKKSAVQCSKCHFFKDLFLAHEGHKTSFSCMHCENYVSPKYVCIRCKATLSS